MVVLLASCTVPCVPVLNGLGFQLPLLPGGRMSAGVVKKGPPRSIATATISTGLGPSARSHNSTRSLSSDRVRDWSAARCSAPGMTIDYWPGRRFQRCSTVCLRLHAWSEAHPGSARTRSRLLQARGVRSVIGSDGRWMCDMER